MWNVKCNVRSVKCKKGRSVKRGGVRSVRCVVQNVERNVTYSM